MSETTNAESGPVKARSIAAVYPGRYTAEMPDDFVVFLIGMRLNRPWKVHTLVPVLSAMPRMLRWLISTQMPACCNGTTPGSTGRPSCSTGGALRSSTASRGQPGNRTGRPGKWFNHAVGASGDVGIWHETYKVHAGEYECVYVNMPRSRLAAAGVHAPIGSTGQSAARRIGATDVDEPALTPYINPDGGTSDHAHTGTRHPSPAPRVSRT